MYIKRAREHSDWVRDVVTACCEAQTPVLYHCTTGKDRTGIISCCLLGAVGVSREDIAADYCLSMVGDVRGDAHRAADHPQGAEQF